MDKWHEYVRKNSHWRWDGSTFGIDQYDRRLLANPVDLLGLRIEFLKETGWIIDNTTIDTDLNYYVYLTHIKKPMKNLIEGTGRTFAIALCAAFDNVMELEVE